MRYLCGILLVLFVVFSPVASGAGVDNTLYAEVLNLYVKDGLVDYTGLSAHRENLDVYLDKLGDLNPDEISRKEQLAFYLNLYNASTLKLIVDHYPLESIKDLGSFFSSPWKKKIVKLRGKLVTLDHIEHDIVRPEFKDARVHFALNCSAMSCPQLLGVPYEAETLDAQLEQVTIAFINDGKNNYLDEKALYVSKIFDWFSEDFPDDLVGWVTEYARGDLKNELLRQKTGNRKIPVQFLMYDWSLNKQVQ